jgi:hypothetical protein
MTGEPNPAATPSTGSPAAFMGLGIASAQDPGDPSRTIVSRGENYRHIRHADVLARWPVIGEAWARSVEATRLGDR